jgi:RNA polymerase sigma-B factor
MDEGDKIASAARAGREYELLRRYHVGKDPRARDQLAEEMLPLARALAGRYSGRGEPMDDLIQVACVGIMKSIEGFDITRDVRFSSYATPTVLGEIKRHFRDRTWAMRVPRGMQELQLTLAKTRDELTNDLGRSPTVQELAGKVGVPFEEVLQTLQSVGARRTRSLDEPAGEGRDTTLAESIGGEDPDLGLAEMRVLLRDALNVLRPRDREVLRLRFEEDLTQTEISRRIGVSQMQVSRIIRESIRRVRHEIEPPERALRGARAQG